MDIYSTAKELLKRTYDKATKPGGPLSFKYPKNYVNPDKYDTKLDVLEESAFRDWLKHKSQATKRNMAMDMQDYDLKGYWKDNVWVRPTAKQYLGSLRNQGHGSDKYKKPNHPTFSKDSKYSGVDGYEGGVWTDKSFTPSPEMKARVSKQGLFKYMKDREPGIELIWTD